MSRSTYKSLSKELRRNNLNNFRAIVETEGLPQDENYFDYDLLMKALLWSRKRIVKYLLNKWCRVNKPWYMSTESAVDTPLHLAAKKCGWYRVIEKMLKMKARVTDVNADGNTPLHLAFINHPSNRTVCLLVDHYLNKSTVDIINNDGLGLLHIATTTADRGGIEDLVHIGKCDVLYQVPLNCGLPFAGYSALHFAVKTDNYNIVKCLCEENADLYARDCNDSTPIHLALERRNVKMIDILFDYDHRNENYVNDFGASHFMAACTSGDPDIVEQYIAIAEEKSSSSVVGMFKGRVRDIPGYEIAGYTGLHFASEFGRYSTITGLLGCEFHLSLTMKGLSPMDLARMNNHEKVCKLLQKHCDQCESCKAVVVDSTQRKIVVEMMTTKVNKSVMNGECVAAVKAMKGSDVFGFSRDRIIFCARTFAVANLPRFVKKWVTKWIDYAMGPKQKCEFCQYFNCYSAKPRRVKFFTRKDVSYFGSSSNV